MQHIPNSATDGFTLLETVVATGVLVTALAGIAQLLALSVRATHDEGSRGAAVLAAQGKIEELRSLALTYDPGGTPITDPALAPTASRCLAEDTDDCVDYLDADGAAVDVDRGEHGAAFTRRWRITPIDHFAPEALAIEVCVFRWPAEGLGPRTAVLCLATVRARQP